MDRSYRTTGIQVEGQGCRRLRGDRAGHPSQHRPSRGRGEDGRAEKGWDGTGRDGTERGRKCGDNVGAPIWCRFQ